MNTQVYRAEYSRRLLYIKIDRRGNGMGHRQLTKSAQIENEGDRDELQNDGRALGAGGPDPGGACRWWRIAGAGEGQPAVGDDFHRWIAAGLCDGGRHARGKSAKFAANSKGRSLRGGCHGSGAHSDVPE